VNAGLMEPPTVAKSKDTTIRVSAAAGEVLRRVAALRGLSIGDYLDAVLLPIARRDLLAEAEKITRESRPKKS
jgi:uncharacterized protein (DUF1778 family)